MNRPIVIVLLICVFVNLLNASLIRSPIIRYRSRKTIVKRSNTVYSSSLYSLDNTVYLVNITVGTPPQDFVVVLDTGSADLWVVGNTCPEVACPVPRFYSNNSGTFTQLNETFVVQYAEGRVTGNYAIDRVSLGKASIARQQFGFVNSQANAIIISDDASVPQASGILGLGYPTPTSSVPQYRPFIFQLIDNQLIPSPIFSVSLSLDTTANWAGEIIFGGIDSNLYSGNLVYSPVVKTNQVYVHWTVQGVGVGVGFGSGKNQSISKGNNLFTFDTGATLTYVPSSTAQSIVETAVGAGNYAYDSGSGVYLVDCDRGNRANRSLSISFSDFILQVPLSQFTMAYNGKNVPSSNNYHCVFGIAPIAIRDIDFLFGLTILRHFYTVYDIGQHRMGFAAAKNSASFVQSIA